MEKVDINKLKIKSGFHLLNYVNKRDISNFSEEIKYYIYFREDYLSREYSIKRKIKLLEKQIQRANDSITRISIRADFNKMHEDLKWIMEGFFELSENDQKSPPKKDFFKSKFLTS